MSNFGPECLKGNSKYWNEKPLSTKTKPEAEKPKNGQFEDTNHQEGSQREGKMYFS